MRHALLWTLLCPSLALAGGLETLGEDDGGGVSDLPVADIDYVSEEATSNIINGEDATEFDYPMTGGTILDASMQSVFGSGDIRTFVCSSTLIAPDVVLLAAHCVDGDAFTMGMGTIDMHSIGWTRQADLSDHDGSRIAPYPEDIVFATKWVQHPEWDINNLRMGIAENFDIALLFLEEPVLDVEPAYLATPEEAVQIAQGMEVDVVGWGQQVATSGFQAPPRGTFALKQWGTSSIAELGAPEFQVGAATSDVRKCHGDSGGPSFAEFDTNTANTTRLIGVTSHAYDQTDCNSTGGVDTRVDYYREWIDTTMRAACDDGTRSWCDEPGVLDPSFESGGGCGCNNSSTGTGAAWMVGLMGLLGLRRRRA